MISIDSTPATHKYDPESDSYKWFTTFRLRITLNPCGREYTHTLVTRSVEVSKSHRNKSATARAKQALNSSPELRDELAKSLAQLTGEAASLATRFNLTPTH